MKRPEWIETRHGWRWDPYQIELLAPGFWVLTRRLDYSRWASVIASGGSLKAMRRRAWRFETTRWNRRRLLSYLAWLLASVAASFAVRGNQILLIPAGVGVFVLTLRTVGLWVGTATGRGWNRLADTYQ